MNKFHSQVEKLVSDLTSAILEQAATRAAAVVAHKKRVAEAQAKPASSPAKPKKRKPAKQAKKAQAPVANKTVRAFSPILRVLEREGVTGATNADVQACLPEHNPKIVSNYLRKAVERGWAQQHFARGKYFITSSGVDFLKRAGGG